MIDFTKGLEEPNNYRGSEKKKTIRLDGKKYLVKFPDPIRTKNKDISYINNAYSEYVGSRIFKLIGFNVQKVNLGLYVQNGKEKIVCGCEDFTDDYKVLYEFESIALGIHVDEKVGTDINKIFDVVEESGMVKLDNFKKWFWDMFIIDALIGNTDRHNGNWGFLSNKKTNSFKVAPIYDCGSCLNPMVDEVEMAFMSEEELKNLALNSYSCLKENGKKINPLRYIETRKNDDCNNALRRIFKRIDIERIKDFIDEIPCIFDIRKKFYKDILEIRYRALKDIYLRENERGIL